MTKETLYKSEFLELEQNGSICELSLNCKKSKVNILSEALLLDLEAVNTQLNKISPDGLIIKSKKDSFGLGADITEFLKYFDDNEGKLEIWLNKVHKIFETIEDFSFPTVSLIQGMCFGGATELALTCDFRIAAEKITMGLPEVKLGIYPGWGGTVRLPRLIGPDNALEWICLGADFDSSAALKFGVVDSVVSLSNLEKSAYKLLEDIKNGTISWKYRKEEKKNPIPLKSPIEAMMIFEGAKGLVLQNTKGNYPAPLEAVEAMQKSWNLPRDKAKEFEIAGFSKVARSEVANSLVSLFLSDQELKKNNKKVTSQFDKIDHSTVIGAGIMGGGIAYQAASRNIPIIMKDINESALNLGVDEAIKILGTQLSRKKIDGIKMAKTVAAIKPSLEYSGIEKSNYAIEAVVENEKIKKSVLLDVEKNLSKNAILASNTSTISISNLAADLKRPDKFCGMHFFNPVHKMPLVEVIRGKKTSEETIQKTVAFAMQLGKKPIVVNDCPGFLVNRILFPYFMGLMHLIRQGVDFTYVDKVMEGFGWPMGPAYLLDVVGLDTASHAMGVLTEGYNERFSNKDGEYISALTSAGKLGQKNKAGFYRYELDKRGKLKKKKDESSFSLLYKDKINENPPKKDEIIAQMMIPMLNESVLCLEEKICSSPFEIDLALIFGIGFPPFRGGAFKFIDTFGASKIVELSKTFESFGNIYKSPKSLVEMAQNNKKYYHI